MKEFEGKTVIISGGSRGIGRALCSAFAKSGANVVFTYYSSDEEAVKLKKELIKQKVNCLSIKADTKDYSECQAVVENAIKKFKKIDILVNNAGIVRDRALVMMSLSDWSDVIETNLNGTFNMTKAVITTFLKQKSGCIINISSVSGITGMPRQTNYSASKAGIIGFSKALAKEAASYNIKVNVIAPGYINTDMVNSLRDDIKQEIIQSIPAKKLGEAADVANLCLFLASEKASYITGEVIKIDGGLTI